MMTKKFKKIITLVFCALTLSSTVALAATTYYFSQNNKDFNDSTKNSNLDENLDNDLLTNSSDKDEYPEISQNLKNRVYPFADKSYKYYYANINQYFYDEPKWDNLIFYRNLMPDYYDSYDQFNLKQDTLYNNLRMWVINAIYKHPFFKNKSDKLFLDIDYKVNVLQKNILINAIWWFGKNYSKNKYWDQIIITLRKHLL